MGSPLKHIPDQTNISNAYVSGLKEDFELYGNELNYFNVCYYVAYVVFQVPGMLLMSRPKLARWLLPTLEVLWGICTFAQSRVTNVHQLYACRFLVGMLEAPVFAGTHFILGSWYSGPELFKRAGTWFICNPLGSMISGYLQAAAYTNLSGVGGMPGWRWLFIIDGIFTLPIALAGFLVFPGIPDSPKPFYFTEGDIALAKSRLERFKIRKPGKLDLDVFRRTLKRWHIWVFVFCYICMIISGYPDSYMNLWLKEEGFSVVQINQLPTVTYAINIVASWLGTTMAAIFPSWTVYTGATTCIAFSSICMIIWDIPKPLKCVFPFYYHGALLYLTVDAKLYPRFIAWYLFGMSGCRSPILYSTVNTVVKGDSEERALILGSMMTFGYSFQIWAPLLLFPTAGPNGAPRWRIGWPVALTFHILLWVGFITAILLHRRDSKDQSREDDNGARDAEDSSSVEEPVLIQTRAQFKD
ncbi:hypothetical protein M434DRAFT_36890 [Hypoxylon sp. CO27-5]|nr:hypothetical protein M434DRAFT_36890 [Hypoxylon sp. CO27-5]